MKESVLKNKKITFLGDSITESCGASSKEKGFVYRLRDKTGANTVELGIGGTRIAYKEEPSTDFLIYDRFFESRLSDIPLDSDIIVVFGGTNDYGHGDAPIGKLGDKTIYTFYGAVDSLIRKLKTVFVNSLIVFATPIHREFEDERGLNLVDFVNAIKDVCNKYNVPVIDTYNIFKVYPNIEEDKIKYTLDGLHPNDLGHDLLSDTFIKELESLLKK